MTKTEWLSALRNRLAGLPEDDIARSLSFYEEMIDDRIEDGSGEEDALAAIGSPEKIAEQILSEISLPKLVKKRIKPSRALRAWEIVLLAVGSPLWLSLAVAAFAVLLSVYIVLWTIVLTVWALTVSFAAVFLGSIAGLVLLCIQGRVGEGLFLLGAGFVFGGLAVLLYLGSLGLTKGVGWLSKKILLGIKSCFIRKEKKGK